MATELYYHTLRIGLLNFLLIGLGVADAFRRKRFALPALGACELAVSLVLFTRVQNTGSHQMLLFLPAYFLLFLAGAAALAEGIERRKAPQAGLLGVHAGVCRVGALLAADSGGPARFFSSTTSRSRAPQNLSGSTA